MATIRAKHYDEAVTVLVHDPVVHAMVAGLRDVPMDGMVHDDGTPQFAFMNSANAEYARRGGTNHAHIGAVAEALIKIVNDPTIVNAKEGTMNTTTTTTTTTKPSRYDAEYARAYRARRAALRADAEFELYNLYEADADELEYDEPEFDDDDTTI